MFSDKKEDMRPVFKAWSLMFVMLFMPGIFSRMVYNPSGSSDYAAPFLSDINVALAIILFMALVLPVLWFLERFAVIPSKAQCYAMLLISACVSYFAGYITFGAPVTAVVLFLFAIGIVTINVLRRHDWYLDDLWIFSIIEKK